MTTIELPDGRSIDVSRVTGFSRPYVRLVFNTSPEFVPGGYKMYTLDLEYAEALRDALTEILEPDNCYCVYVTPDKYGNEVHHPCSKELGHVGLHTYEGRAW